MNSPPPTLAFLASNWGDAYLFSHVRDRWVALRRDARYFLAASTTAELAGMVEEDYERNPGPRDFNTSGPGASTAAPARTGHRRIAGRQASHLDR